MISSTISARQRELAERREPFVTATVVKVTRPTSAHAGNVALVRADGVLEGFVGGICAATSVRLYALEALAVGEPLLLSIVPDPAVEDPDAAPVGDGQEIAREPGAVTVRNPCLSGGAIEVFLEPALPAPRVIVAGASPIAEKLLELGALVDLEMVRGAEPAAGDLGLVVAAHGRDELAALAAATAAHLPYVGLVASPRRGAAVLAELAELGTDVSRVETPAGLDLGARTAAEVALSILARVIAVRRTGARGAGAGHRGPAPAELGVAHVPGGRAAATPAPVGVQTGVDPVCGMTVIIDADTPQLERDGLTHVFCCEGCRRSFADRVA